MTGVVALPPHIETLQEGAGSGGVLCLVAPSHAGGGGVCVCEWWWEHIEMVWRAEGRSSSTCLMVNVPSPPSLHPSTSLSQHSGPGLKIRTTPPQQMPPLMG